MCFMQYECVNNFLYSLFKFKMHNIISNSTTHRVINMFNYVAKQASNGVLRVLCFSSENTAP